MAVTTETPHKISTPDPLAPLPRECYPFPLMTEQKTPGIICGIDYNALDMSKYGKVEIPAPMSDFELREEIGLGDFRTERELANHFEENICAYFAYMTGGDLVAGIEREVVLPRGIPMGGSIGRLDMLVTGVSGHKYIIEFKNKAKKSGGKFGEAAGGAVQALTYKLVMEDRGETIKHTFLVAGFHDFVIRTFLAQYSLPVSYFLLRKNVMYRLS